MNPIFIKNIIIHAILIPYYFFAVQELKDLPVAQLDTLLLFVGLIVIAPITSNFIYGYGNTKTKKSEYWGHLTTFFSMIVIGMLFIILDILLISLIGNLLIFRLTLILFWIAVITFDFADWETRKMVK